MQSTTLFDEPPCIFKFKENNNTSLTESSKPLPKITQIELINKILFHRKVFFFLRNFSEKLKNIN
jgi:hypothetical protein